MTEYLDFAKANLILFIALAVIIALIIKVEIDRFTRKYKTVNTNEAVQLLNRDDTVVLDVREDKEVSEGMINGAKHIPLGQLSSRISELDKYKDKPILVYCRSGHRSGAACKQLTKAGFSDVSNLIGGIMSWESANLPIKKR